MRTNKSRREDAELDVMEMAESRFDSQSRRKVVANGGERWVRFQERSAVAVADGLC